MFKRMIEFQFLTAAYVIRWAAVFLCILALSNIMSISITSHNVSYVIFRFSLGHVRWLLIQLIFNDIAH